MSAVNINRVLLTGNLTADPELKTTPNGTKVCRLRLANNQREKQGDDWGDRVNYFDITVFGAQGENCARYLAKGRPVAIDGRLRWEEWQTDEGGKRQAIKIIADAVQFLGSHEGGGSTSSAEGEAAAVPASATPEDDIPFLNDGFPSYPERRGHQSRW